MTILKPPCAPFLDIFGLNERMRDSQGQVRTQGNALELLEVAMWVALTQHQSGRKFLFEHPAYYSTGNKFERFRGFLELISRFEFEFRRRGNYFFCTIRIFGVFM